MNLYYSVRKRLHPTVATIVLFAMELIVPPRPEEVEANLLKQILHPRHTVLEVGARTGGSTCLIASLVGKEGRVIAIEPNPFAFKGLLSFTRGMTNVRVLNLAAGDREGTVQISMEYVSDGGATVLSHRNWRTETVKMMRIDDIVRVLQISKLDVMIVDVEGSESQVLKGSLDTLKFISNLVVEVHQFVNPNMEDNIERIVTPIGFKRKESKIDSLEPLIKVNWYAKGQA